MSAANGQGAVETNGLNGADGVDGTNGTNGKTNGIARDGAPTHPHLNPHAAGGVNHEANFEVVTDGRRKRNNDAEEAQKEHDRALGKDENQIKKENKSGVDEDEATAAAPSGHQQPKRRGTSGVKDKYKSQKDKIKAKTKPEGGFDATPVPDAPPGYTVKFTFHRATNLPAADLGTQASDPFCLATLTTSLPKRHKEDPNLEHRTPTIRKTLEPVWNDEWVVANVPASGFKLKVRLYDEDWPDHNDRLGNVTVMVHQLNEQWKGFPVADFEVKKRAGSKRAYLVKAATTALHRGASMTPRLFMSAEVLGLSDSPPHAHMYTVAPTFYFRHFSPMIGRLAGLKVNRDEENDHSGGANGGAQASASAQAEARDDTANTSGANHSNDQAGGSNKTQKYDFQANEIQLQGPVPTKLYHRYVEFRPMIGMMFSRSGLRGRILHKALSHQHRRIYNFDSSTEYHRFEPCTEEASLQFLKLAHYDEGGRIFTYVLTLDGLFRFTETGKEFGIDLLSKHTMHSDVAAYIACSGEFLIRRLQKPTADKSPEPNQPTHPQNPDLPGGPPNDKPPTRPEYYQLVIDNDSGTYRPDKSVLPDLQKFLEKNFPGLGIVTLACDDDEDQKLKEQQREVKKNEGQNVHMVLNRSPSSSSFSSDDVSDLEETERHANAASARRSRKERMLDIMAEDSPIKAMRAEFGKGGHDHTEGGRRGLPSRGGRLRVVAFS
ncbi:C2 domain-containing protein [Apiospora aurea]|uniref:C2 domain-containing protein n=1 Tax=Apiospora aurea TaxID=335848 RepID=A0ABR1QFT3_9PEZI